MSKIVHNNKEVLEYWNNPKVESMYDKNLIKLEIKLIDSYLSDNSKILDAGCGEGEGTLVYAKRSSVEIDAVDFSKTRLKKAGGRLSDCTNVKLAKVDFLGDYTLDTDYDYIISQRFLINLMEWKLQKKVILDLASHLKTGGRLLLLEGSEDGVNQLNNLRKELGLSAIDVKWHNLFFKDSVLESFIEENGLKLIEKDGLGEYFFLTRGIRPYFDSNLDWDTDFNSFSASLETKQVLNLKSKFSRLVLWVIEK